MGVNMCGICGFYRKTSISMEQLKYMNDSMVHRGPDDSGELIFGGEKGGYTVGLAHRRLSILDLTHAGHQPMSSPDGRVTIVFNGEIYNYGELKKELCNYHYCSNCDTEVILASYLRWGIECVHHFDGMFAIALYDRLKNELILMRDRIGKKPLYYWMEEDGLVFSSELKPIMLYPGFERVVRRDIIPQYLLKQYICAPNTIFENVYKLEHGSILRYKNGEAKTEKYWDIADVYKKNMENPINDYFYARMGLKERLKRAVGRRLAADVPVGALLSGGYDSSLVAAMAQEYLGSKQLYTFSIGFNEEAYNEAEHAKQVSAYLGTKHTELYCTENDMQDLLLELPKYYDEPFADASEIPTMLVSKLARGQVTVALSGDGGDEFFCGYNVYDTLKKAESLDKVGKLLHMLGKIGNLEKHYPFPIKTITQNTNENTKTQLISKSYIDAVISMAINAEDTLFPLYENELSYRVDNWQTRRMLMDMDTYLPEDILTKVDRASMKYSLECRCPILDKEVMEYSFRIIHRYKYYKNEKKFILKDITHDYLPSEIMDRPKMGFGIPLDKWLRGILREKLYDYSDISFLKRQGIFNPNNTSQIVRFYLEHGNQGAGKAGNYAGICWSFFIFQQWYGMYIGQ